MNLSITNLNEATLLISMEYWPQAVYKIKQLGQAKWDSTLKGWKLSTDYKDEVRKILLDYYGTDGSFSEKIVNIELLANQEIKMPQKPVLFAGKNIAQAFNRDSGARVGQNVALIGGDISSGGSSKNWETIVEKGSRFKVMHVNEQLLSFENDKLFTYKIIDSNKSQKLSRLRKVSDEELIAELISRKLTVEHVSIEGAKS
jgi:hypothetical protein